MKKFELEFNWASPPSKRKTSPESSTWAEFSIRVNEQAVTEHYDLYVRDISDRLYIPLYPIAEWIVLNWWHILYEPLARERSRYTSYFYRHNLKFARGGFSLPDLGIQPQGNTVLLTWKGVTLINHKCRFLGEGSAIIDLISFEDTLLEFIEAVIKRLENNEIKDTLLQKEWAAIQNADDDEKEFCIAAAEMGVDPYNHTEAEAALIIKANEELPKSILREFYSASASERIGTDVESTIEAIELIKDSQIEFPHLKRIKHKLSDHHSLATPWKEGYNAARLARKAMGLNGKAIDTMHSFENVLNAKISDIVRPLNSELSDPIRVISGDNGTQSPIFVLSRKTIKSEHSKKFNLARGLYEYFWGTGYSLVTDVDLESQKRNRAFAAEFLLPSKLLRDRVKTEFVSIEQIEDLAAEFNISPMVVGHQIENHGIAQINSPFREFN